MNDQLLLSLLELLVLMLAPQVKTRHRTRSYLTYDRLCQHTNNNNAKIIKVETTGPLLDEVKNFNALTNNRNQHGHKRLCNRHLLVEFLLRYTIVHKRFLLFLFFNISIVQINMYISSNALHNSTEINIAQITVLQLLFNKSSQTKCWFLMRGENRSTRGKTSQSRVENQTTKST